VGELFTPSNHGEVAAALLAPYVPERISWILAHHEVFQMKYYGEAAGLNPDGRERWADSPHFAECEKFCLRYDQAAFDASATPRPLSFFEPMVRRVFGRKPYWHDPSHPKCGAVLGE
jgi:predicted HD phosphohydrolase